MAAENVNKVLTGIYELSDAGRLRTSFVVKFIGQGWSPKNGKCITDVEMRYTVPQSVLRDANKVEGLIPVLGRVFPQGRTWVRTG